VTGLSGPLSRHSAPIADSARLAAMPAVHAKARRSTGSGRCRLPAPSLVTLTLVLLIDGAGD
jgi:hypothetical protein